MSKFEALILLLLFYLINIGIVFAIYIIEKIK